MDFEYVPEKLILESGDKVLRLTIRNGPFLHLHEIPVGNYTTTIHFVQEGAFWTQTYKGEYIRIPEVKVYAKHHCAFGVIAPEITTIFLPPRPAGATARQTIFPIVIPDKYRQPYVKIYTDTEPVGEFDPVDPDVTRSIWNPLKRKRED